MRNAPPPLEAIYPEGVPDDVRAANPPVHPDGVPVKFRPIDEADDTILVDAYQKKVFFKES